MRKARLMANMLLCETSAKSWSHESVFVELPPLGFEPLSPVTCSGVYFSLWLKWCSIVLRLAVFRFISGGRRAEMAHVWEQGKLFCTWRSDECTIKKSYVKNNKVILHSDFNQNVFKILEQNQTGVEFLSTNTILNFIVVIIEHFFFVKNFKKLM